MEEAELALSALEELAVERLTALVELRHADVLALETQCQQVNSNDVDAEYAQVRLFVARQNLRLAQGRLRTERQAQLLRRAQLGKHLPSPEPRRSADGSDVAADS